MTPKPPDWADELVDTKYRAVVGNATNNIREVISTHDAAQLLRDERERSELAVLRRRDTFPKSSVLYSVIDQLAAAIREQGG